MRLGPALRDWIVGISGLLLIVGRVRASILQTQDLGGLEHVPIAKFVSWIVVIALFSTVTLLGLRKRDFWIFLLMWLHVAKVVYATATSTYSFSDGGWFLYFTSIIAAVLLGLMWWDEYMEPFFFQTRGSRKGSGQVWQEKENSPFNR